MAPALHQKQQFHWWISSWDNALQHCIPLHRRLRVSCWNYPHRSNSLGKTAEDHGKALLEHHQPLVHTLPEKLARRDWGRFSCCSFLPAWVSLCSSRASVNHPAGASQDICPWHFRPTLMEEKFRSPWTSKHCPHPVSPSCRHCCSPLVLAHIWIKLGLFIHVDMQLLTPSELVSTVTPSTLYLCCSGLVGPAPP